MEFSTQQLLTATSGCQSLAKKGNRLNADSGDPHQDFPNSTVVDVKAFLSRKLSG
jgi:hypothetical protein